MSKKTKRELEGSESEEEEDSTGVEAAAKAEETDEEEESTRTRNLVSQWSKYHGPTRDFTSKRRWRGDHGGAQYRCQKGSEEVEECQGGSPEIGRDPLHRWSLPQGSTKN